MKSKIKNWYDIKLNGIGIFDLNGVYGNSDIFGGTHAYIKSGLYDGERLHYKNTIGLKAWKYEK